eukprot:2114566-Rhodomonas_salina.1
MFCTPVGTHASARACSLGKRQADRQTETGVQTERQRERARESERERARERERDRDRERETCTRHARDLVLADPSPLTRDPSFPQPAPPSSASSPAARRLLCARAGWDLDQAEDDVEHEDVAFLG